MSNYAPYARIIARYLAASGVTLGVLDVGFWLEPDTILVLSGLLGAAVEGWYEFAKRRGGST